MENIMNLLKSLKSLFGNKNVGVYVMGGNSENKKSNKVIANNENQHAGKRVFETVLEASQKRYDEDEQTLIAELPIVRNQLLEGIAEGYSMFHPDISLSKPSDFENHPAILEEKLWWKGEGMYLRITSLSMSSCLSFEVEEDKNGMLNRMDEKERLEEEAI